MSSTIDIWIEAVRARIDHTSSDDKHQSSFYVDAIESLLHNRSSPQATALDLTNFMAPIIRNEGQAWSQQHALGRLWFLIGDVARACGQELEHSQRLADLVRAITHTSDLLGHDGKLIRNAQESIYWSGLPWFHLEIRETIAPEWFNGLGIDETVDLEPAWQTQADPVLGATTFLGSLFNCLETDEHLAPMIWLCLNTSEGDPGLEVDLPPIPDTRYAEQHCDQRSHMVMVACAATMVLVAGAKIRRLCQSILVIHHGRRFDNEHWSFWQQNFISHSDVQVFPPKIRNLCERAAAHMKSISSA